MTTNHKKPALLWTIGALALALGLMAATPEAAVVNSPDILADCQEDMPCWDCETMGNLQCGPLSPDAAAQGVAEDAYDMGYAEGYEEGSIAAN